MKNYIADSDYGTKTIRVPSATSTTGTARQLEQTRALEEQGAINDLEPHALAGPLFQCTVGFDSPPTMAPDQTWPAVTKDYGLFPISKEPCHGCAKAVEL